MGRSHPGLREKRCPPGYCTRLAAGSLKAILVIALVLLVCILLWNRQP